MVMLTLAEVRKSQRVADFELIARLETSRVRAKMTPIERLVFEAVGETLIFYHPVLTPNWRAWALEILARVS